MNRKRSPQALMPARAIRVLLQPGCELTSLLRFQIYAVVYSLHGLLQRALGGGFMMGCEEVLHLISHATLAERASRSCNSSACVCAPHTLEFFPVRADEVPGEFLS